MPMKFVAKIMKIVYWLLLLVREIEKKIVIFGP